MYHLTANGVLKKIETWELIIPRYDNEGNRFEDSILDSILEDLTLNFRGCMLTNCVGYWMGPNKTYRDPNLQVIIDVSAFETGNAEEYFFKLKNELRTKLKQEKIYLKKTNKEEEALTFDEFFEELGLATAGGETEERKRKLAEKCVEEPENIIKRLSYKTLGLRRDRENNKIVWEREICGFILKDEFEDDFPEDIKVFAADQIEEIGDVIIREDRFAIIGQYEFQNYIVAKFNYRPLTPSVIEENAIDSDFKFYSPSLGPIGVKKFVEEIVATISTNYIILKEEGFGEDEIFINVGEDGSLQQGKSENAHILMHTPAMIPFPVVIKEIVRCLGIALGEYEKNEIDPIAVLQAKAKNKYVLKRAQIRNTLKRISG